MKPTPLESKIQKKIQSNLERNGWLVVKIIQCTLNGWPDLMAFKCGETICVEVKKPGEQPTALQLLRHRQLAAARIAVFVTSDEKFTL